MQKTVTPTHAGPGEPVTFTLSITNAGALTATGVLVTDDVPAGVRVQQVISSGVAITGTGSGYAWQVADLAPQAEGILTLTGLLSIPLVAGPLTNSAYITGTGVEGNSWDNGDTAVVTVTNRAPVADAGPDRTAGPGQVVALDGSGSDDPNGDPLAYGWTQTGGPAVELHSSTAVSPTFTARAAGRLTFTLTVTDAHGLASPAPDAVAVTVTNAAPLAHAGPDRLAGPGERVTLDGSDSSDPNGDPLAYGWTQTGGPAVSFTPSLSVTAFTAPTRTAVLTFTLTVTDPGGLRDADVAVVSVSRPDYEIFMPLLRRN